MSLPTTPFLTSVVESLEARAMQARKALDQISTGPMSAEKDKFALRMVDEYGVDPFEALLQIGKSRSANEVKEWAELETTPDFDLVGVLEFYGSVEQHPAESESWKHSADLKASVMSMLRSVETQLWGVSEAAFVRGLCSALSAVSATKSSESRATRLGNATGLAGQGPLMEPGTPEFALHEAKHKVVQQAQLLAATLKWEPKKGRTESITDAALRVILPA